MTNSNEFEIQLQHQCRERRKGLQKVSSDEERHVQKSLEKCLSTLLLKGSMSGEMIHHKLIVIRVQKESRLFSFF